MLLLGALLLPLTLENRGVAEVGGHENVLHWSPQLLRPALGGGVPPPAYTHTLDIIGYNLEHHCKCW